MSLKFRRFDLSPTLPIQPKSIDEFLGMNRGSIEAVAHVCGCPLDLIAVQSVRREAYETVYSVAFTPSSAGDTAQMTPVISARRGGKNYANLPDPGRMRDIKMYAEAASAIAQAAPKVLERFGSPMSSIMTWRSSSGRLESRCNVQGVQVSILTWKKPNGRFATSYQIAGTERPGESEHTAQIYKALKPVLGLL